MDEDAKRLIAQQTASIERLIATVGGGQGRTNIVLLRMLLAMGLEAPEGLEVVLAQLPKEERVPGVAVPLGIPVSMLEKETTVALTYIDILEWVIPAGHAGQLFEICLATTDYDKTQFRLVIAGEEQWADKYLQTALTQKWRDNKLPASSKVLIQAKSSDGSGCTIYAALAGKRIPPPYRKAGII